MTTDDPAHPGGAESDRGQAEVAAVIGADRTVIRWTRAAERIWGYPASEVLNRPADLLLVPRDDTSTPDLRVYHPWSGSVEIKRRDGQGMAVDLRVFRLLGGNAAGAPHNEDGGENGDDGTGGDGDWCVWTVGPAEPRELPGLNASVIRTLLEHSPIGMAFWDTDLRCTWYNESAVNQALFLGRPPLGRSLPEILTTESPGALEVSMRQVLSTGRPAFDHEWRIPPTEEEGEAYYSLTFFRLDGADGRPLGVCSTATDITESWARRRFSVLSEAGVRIGTTLDVLKTAQELAETAVPTLADYVSVDLAEAVSPDDEPLEHLPSTHRGIPAFYRAGMASVRPDIPESLWQRGTPVFTPPTSPFTTVQETGRSHYEPTLDIDGSDWITYDPDRHRVIRETGMHSLIVVALRARGTVLGIASFVRTENPLPFCKADLILAEGLAERAALSLDNARRYSRERKAALTLQRDLMPLRLSGGRAVEVASRYLPADTHGGVGGDWYDAIPLSDDRVALVVGDVVGHGINAAATMGRLRTAVTTLTNLELSPEDVLVCLDQLAVDLERGRDGPGPSACSFMGSCVYVVYDPATRRCTMCSAGHPPPAIVSPDGHVEFVDLPTGTPIGVGLLDFEQVEMELAEGSLIALYTDGLVETRDDDIDRGLRRLRTCLTDPGAELEDICSGVIDTMTAEQRTDDDIALLLARTLVLPDPPTG